MLCTQKMHAMLSPEYVRLEKPVNVGVLQGRSGGVGVVVSRHCHWHVHLGTGMSQVCRVGFVLCCQSQWELKKSPINTVYRAVEGACIWQWVGMVVGMSICVVGVSRRFCVSSPESVNKRKPCKPALTRQWRAHGCGIEQAWSLECLFGRVLACKAVHGWLASIERLHFYGTLKCV